MPPTKRPAASEAVGASPDKKPRSLEEFASLGFTSLRVHIAVQAIPNGSRRLKSWQAGLERHGAAVLQVVDRKTRLTHIVAGDECAEKLPLTPGQIQRRHIIVVTPQWLESCLAKAQRVDEEKFKVHLEYCCDSGLDPAFCSTMVTLTLGIAAWYETEEEGSMQSPSKQQDSTQDSASTKPGRMYKYRRWLGYWNADLDNVRTETELALHAVYSEDVSKSIGNEPIVQALKELMKYETAMLVTDEEEDKGSSPTSSRSVHDNSLVYSRVAAMVRACQFKIDENLQPDTIPFCGQATANKICDIARTGTTDVLEAHRADAMVKNSAGAVRSDTGGGATRRLFMQLPGVGAKTAKIWFDLGYRSYEDLDDAIDNGDVRSDGGRLPISYEQAFSLTHRADLLEALPPSDLDDMHRAVTEALEHVTGTGGWNMVVVGGGRRSLPSHDGDFVITHPTRSTEGVVRLLVNRLVETNMIFSSGKAMCRVTEGHMRTHLDHMKDHVTNGTNLPEGNIAVDRFDKLFGMFRTEAGKVRRMDLIFTPPEEYPFCLLGWTGSKQYLRFLRQHAGNSNMYLNSHRLMRKDGQQAILVPGEGCPNDRDGSPCWPQGWDQGRAVTDEGDIMELLGVPRREPHERNCP